LKGAHLCSLAVVLGLVLFWSVIVVLRIATEDLSCGSMYGFPLSMEIVRLFQKRKEKGAHL